MAESVTEPKLYSRQELEDLISSSFKAFCKLPCGQCGKVACKRFATSMPFVVKTMVGSFWCEECGRLLCESHRSQHTCERFDAKKEKNFGMTHEQIKEELEEKARRQLEAEEAEKAAKKEVALAAENRRLEMKGRRKVIAGKAKAVEDCLQQIAREDTRPKQVLNEIFELYTRAKRIALHLYNEIDSPSVQGLDEDDWTALKDIYARARELTGVVIVSDGQPLSMINPWEQPPPDPVSQ
eukprot:TRINITY_DN13471_c0_g6_i1.p1 TRINITY_DN13471_c0_g6~~TRINITY_DN13471_c0_g6_i1.p1  ORF type:complete len:254 (-),score=64.22 TRINITY_DN13471_c0_g6_i1:82-798(-)